MLYFIGLGLGDERDVTVKGLEIIRQCERVYLEAYTSVLMGSTDPSRLETFYERKVVIADRELVEMGSDEILAGAADVDVAFLVVGDPYGATTHTDLALRARERGIPVRTIHNASIMNAVGACGLQLYNFGQTISLVFFTETWRPDSFYEKIAENITIGLHTLCLLDIKVKEPTLESLARGRVEYEPPRYMTVSQAIKQLLEVTENREEKAYTTDTIAVGVARLGGETQLIQAGTLAQLCSIDFGAPLHSLILVGRRLHHLEADSLRAIAVDVDTLNVVLQRDYGIQE